MASSANPGQVRFEAVGEADPEGAMPGRETAAAASGDDVLMPREAMASTRRAGCGRPRTSAAITTSVSHLLIKFRVMESGTLEVAGCSIAWCGVGEPEGEAMMLVHGNRAHRHWWDAAVEAGLDRAGRRVVAMDLSGHGDSGRRDEYSPEVWADEVLAAIERLTRGSATIVGHSMGGLVAVVAAARRPDIVSGLVLVETGIRLSKPETARVPRGTPPRSPRTFASRDAAIESIRLFPEQPVVDAEVLRRVAELSISGADGEWTWKFDPGVARRFTDELINRNLAAVECPVAMVYADGSALVDSSSPEAAEAILGRPVPTTVVAGAYHHLVLDRPAAGAKAILGSMTAWRFSPSTPPAR
jgi:pimeloyl-ACP methyl ester carboxylesterase